ncbi:hypothetical protein [Flavobacterium oreochromis]|uniref:hypothetical protein n=1 Tax=Flavobacterium oreochromis TaxID=2906078 RepID=UPI00385EBCE8
MKKLLIITLLFLFSLNLLSQKKLEATNNQTGKTITIVEGARIKLTTLDRKKWVGEIKFKDFQTLTIDNNDIPLSNISSIKNHPLGKRKAKNILLGIGSGLIVGSEIAGLAKDGTAFSLFLGGIAIAITGALLNNQDKTLIYRDYTYKIVE